MFAVSGDRLESFRAAVTFVVTSFHVEPEVGRYLLEVGELFVCSGKGVRTAGTRVLHQLVISYIRRYTKHKHT